MFLYNPIGKTLAEVHKDCGGILYLFFEDICPDIFEAIRARYKSVNEDPVRKWRRRHKRCSFCNHFEPYPDVPCVIRTGENGWCRAKNKGVNYSRRRICRLFELKGKLK